MFKGRTLFVIGAGASADLNFPVGSALKTDISKLLSGDLSRTSYFDDRPFAAALQQYAETLPPEDHRYQRLVMKARFVQKNMPLAPSIDNFLNSHRDDADVTTIGKLAITRIILQKELSSHLYMMADGAYQIPRYKETFDASWHMSLWHHLNADIDRERVRSIFDNVAFIIFNYDRCVEHFLFMCLRDYYDLDEDDAAEIMNSATFIHPYGQVGNLPWQAKANATRFGETEPVALLGIATEIRTFMEANKEGVAEMIAEQVDFAETMVILGFGFLDQNMKLLSTASHNSQVQRVFLTTYELSYGDEIMAFTKVGRAIGKRGEVNLVESLGPQFFEVHTMNGKCLALMAANQLRLPEKAQTLP